MEIPGFKKSAEQRVSEHYRERDGDNAEIISKTESSKKSGIVIKDEVLKKALLHTLYSDLKERTKDETYHLFKPEHSAEMVAENDRLRELLRQLIVDLDNPYRYAPRDWLLAGIQDFLEIGELEKISKEEWNGFDESSVIARFLIEKKTPSKK